MANKNNLRDSRFNSEMIISGIPWVTSSLASATKTHIFADTSNNPLMTQWVQIKNTGTSGSLAVAFTSTGFATNNYFTIAAGTSFEKPLMTYQIFVSGAASQPYSLCAGLTRINASLFSEYLSSSAGYSNI